MFFLPQNFLTEYSVLSGHCPGCQVSFVRETVPFSGENVVNGVLSGKTWHFPDGAASCRKDGECRFLWHGVVAGAAPRMAAEKTAYGEIQPLERAPFAECLQCVFGTCRSEAACRRFVRRDADPVEFYQDDERKYRDFFHDFSGSAMSVAACRILIMPVFAAFHVLFFRFGVLLCVVVRVCRSTGCVLPGGNGESVLCRGGSGSGSRELGGDV